MEGLRTHKIYPQVMRLEKRGSSEVEQIEDVTSDPFSRQFQAGV